MKTAKLTPGVWLDRLKAKQYKTLGNVKKAIAKTSWSPKTRASAISVATSFFASGVKSLPEADVKALLGAAAPTAVKAPAKKGAKAKPASRPQTPATKDVVADNASVRMGLLTAKEFSQLSDARALVAVSQEIINAFKDVKALIPDADVSDAQTALSNLESANELVETITRRAHTRAATSSPASRPSSVPSTGTSGSGGEVVEPKAMAARAASAGSNGFHHQPKIELPPNPLTNMI
jgi:hypothetical protein